MCVNDLICYLNIEVGIDAKAEKKAAALFFSLIYFSLEASDLCN